MKLPNDYSRCLDEECPLAERCARYLQRAWENGDGWMVMTHSLREGEGECQSFIEDEK